MDPSSFAILQINGYTRSVEMLCVSIYVSVCICLCPSFYVSLYGYECVCVCVVYVLKY